MLTHLEGYDESLGAVIQCTPASRPRTACICTSASASASTSANTSTSTSSVAAARQLGGLHGGRTSSRSHGVRREEVKVGQVLRQHDLPCSSTMSTHDGLPASIPSCPTLSTCIIRHKAPSSHGSHLGCGQRWQHGVELCKQTKEGRDVNTQVAKEWIGHAPRTASMSWRLSRSPRKAATRARCGLPMAAVREPPHTASRTRYTPAVGRPSLGPSTPPCCRLLACRRALASSTLLSSPATGRKACTQSNNDSLPSLSPHPPRPPRNQHSTHSSSRGQRRPLRCLSRHHSSPVRVAVSHQLAHILPRDGSSPRARSLPDGVSGDKPCSSKTVSAQKKGKGCVWAIATHLVLPCHKPQRRPRCEPGLQAWTAATELPVCVHLHLLEHRATVRYWQCTQLCEFATVKRAHQPGHASRSVAASCRLLAAAAALIPLHGCASHCFSYCHLHHAKTPSQQKTVQTARGVGWGGDGVRERDQERRRETERGGSVSGGY